MNSQVWKTGIVVMCFVLLHCVNELPSTVHLVLNLEAVTQNDSTRVIITTSVPQEYSYYRIIDDSCALTVSYRKIINDIDSTIVDIRKIANDSASSAAGTFKGEWPIPDNLSFDSLYPNTPVFFTGSLTDETSHNVNASLVFSADTTLTAIR